MLNKLQVHEKCLYKYIPHCDGQFCFWNNALFDIYLTSELTKC